MSAHSLLASVFSWGNGAKMAAPCGKFRPRGPARRHGGAAPAHIGLAAGTVFDLRGAVLQ